MSQPVSHFTLRELNLFLNIVLNFFGVQPACYESDLLIFFCSSKGKEAKAGGRSGKTTFWPWAKESPTTELWHHTAIITRAVRPLWHCQVWRGRAGSQNTYVLKFLIQNFLLFSGIGVGLKKYCQTQLEFIKILIFSTFGFWQMTNICNLLVI